MKRNRTVITLLLVGILGMLAYTWFTPTQAISAPDLNVETTTGRNINFANISQHKPVLVAFWATSCKSCLKEMPHFIALYEALHSKGLELISVTMDYDPPIRVVAAIRQYDIPYPVVMDLDKQIMRAFGMKHGVTPTTFLIAPGGELVMRKVGPLDMQQLEQQIVGYL